ncbi:MAG: hypothetical protein AAGF11_44445 [Myxococcota bacterium]
MKCLDLLAALGTAAALCTLPACGPELPGNSDSNSGTSGSESESNSNSGFDSGSTTDPPPTDCFYEEELYDNGVEFETPDGCLRFRCEQGSLDILTDNRVTVAGDLDLPSQEAVDEQVCLSVVEGSLTISGTAADLTTLGQLSRVGGNLDITAADATSLTGLERLAEVGGYVTIADNANLTTLAFQAYMSVFGDVTIQNNDALVSLAGAEFIGQCGWCSIVPGNEPSADGKDEPGREPSGAGPGGNAEGGAPAEDGADEPGGGTFYGNILIADNDVLTDITAMSNLWYAWADLRFRNNAALTSLTTMQVNEVQGSLEVSNHPTMDTNEVEEFVSFVDVWGETMICGNQGGNACP